MDMGENRGQVVDFDRMNSSSIEQRGGLPVYQLRFSLRSRAIREVYIAETVFMV